MLDSFLHAASARARLLASLGVMLFLAVASPASAKPELPEWLKLDLEYRVETTYIDPLELSGVVADDIHFTDQRFRIDAGFQIPSYGGIFMQMDLLDGVLFGDNGDYGSDPEPTSGLAVTSRWPNHAGWDVGLLPGEDPLDPDSYGPVLTDINPIQLNRVWGEVYLPIGLIRIGRQPATTGPGISLHDGSRSNRWGVSRYEPTADRFLFATKISEAIRMFTAGEGYVPDRSMDDGVFIAVAYDMVVQDDISVGGDDLHQVLGMVQWKAKDPDWGGLDWHDLKLQVAVGGRFGDEFDTEIFAVPVTFEWGLGPVHFLGEFSTIFGNTREISEGLAALRQADETRRVIHNQEILGFGARAVLDVEIGPVVATLEFDYASGDSDPRDDSAQTTFYFARDMNVGLLLFEHVLAFESARSAHVGIENLSQLGSDSFPITELRSEGRFHNGIVLFPQVLYRPIEDLGIRFGALVAWADAPVTDPIMTLLNEDGEKISDDAVNWHGGKPARFYGTELDLQIEWSFREFFIWTLEGAVLFPGPALEDESGDATTAFLVQNRFTFVF